jgi:folate-binding protein YgfZ
MSLALETLHTDHDAAMGESGGGSVALHYGDFDAELRAVEAGAGIYDHSACGVILIRGAESGVFLNGLTTNNIESLAVGALQPNLLCANKGKILHDILVLRTKLEEYLVITGPGEGDAVAVHMDGYHIREDAELGMVGLARLDLIGARGGEILESIGLSPASAGATFEGMPLLTARHPLGTTPCIVMLLPESMAPRLARTLLDSDDRVTLIGQYAADELRIQDGVPRFEVDYDSSHLPEEAGLNTHLAYDKGCYVGQEIHARMHYRGHPNRKLVALRLPAEDADSRHTGDALYQDGTAVGALTSLARQPQAGHRAAIAMVRYSTVQSGEPLALAPEETGEASMHPLATDLGVARA